MFVFLQTCRDRSEFSNLCRKSEIAKRSLDIVGEQACFVHWQTYKYIIHNLRSVCHCGWLVLPIGGSHNRIPA
jgi:hypothetical protein